LLQGFNRGGNREAVGSIYVSRYFILLIHLRDEKEKVRVWFRKGNPIYAVSKMQCRPTVVIIALAHDRVRCWFVSRCTLIIKFCD
jgi:hypothetical protein